MSESATGKFACQACGRTFAWKPELAGRSAKCKCGATVKIPSQPMAAGAAKAAAPRAAASAAAAPAAAPADEGNPLDAYDFSQAQAAAPAPGRGGSARAAAAPAADAGMRCPSCSAAMQPGAVICMSCGFNLKTGKRMATVMGGPDVDAPAPGAPAAAAPGIPGVPGYAGPPGLRPARTQETTDKTAIVKLILIPIVLICVVGGAVFGYKKLAGEKDTGPDLGHDKQVRAMIREEGSTELKKWLVEGNTRMLTGMTREQADGMADRLYGLGAVQVFTFGSVMSMSFAIELPDPAVPENKAKRKAIFDWYYMKYAENVSAAERVRDVGQKYLLVYPGL